tara:strand:- start:19151 stop:19900 length:750 start_codon:yes stop_codon:yes gene_type:complete
MKFFKSILNNIIHYLQFVTLGFLKFLSKLQSRVNNSDKEYYPNLKSSLEKELSQDDANKAMDLLADEYAELESKPNADIGKDYFSKIRSYLQKELDTNINLKKTLMLDAIDHYYISDDIENLALKHSLEDSFNSGSKYSEIMNKICFIEDAALRASDKLLSNDLTDMCYKDECDENKFGNLTFDKRRRAVYLLNKIRRDEIREAAKKCKMFFASKFNEELEKTESPIDDISCDVGVRDTDVATVTRGSY